MMTINISSLHCTIYSVTKAYFLPKRTILGRKIIKVRCLNQPNKKPLRKFSENFYGVVLGSKSLNLMTLGRMGSDFSVRSDCLNAVKAGPCKN